MIAAFLVIETAKNELEKAGLPQAEAVSKASDILSQKLPKKNSGRNRRSQPPVRLRPSDPRTDPNTFVRRHDLRRRQS